MAQIVQWSLKFFGHRLEWLMKESGISQRTLATYLGTSNATVNRWIKGESEPSRKNIVKICKFFGVSADWLLGTESMIRRTII